MQAYQDSLKLESQNSKTRFFPFKMIGLIDSLGSTSQKKNDLKSTRFLAIAQLLGQSARGFLPFLTPIAYVSVSKPRDHRSR
jgi:hypothetical protein